MKTISLFQESDESYDHDDYDSNESANYHFKYSVEDYYGNDFGHEEWRDGDKTEGTYHVLMPNEVRQIVKYIVDGYSGYQADVTYEGTPKSDSYEHDSGSYGQSSEEYDDDSDEYGYRRGRYDYDRR